MRTIYVSAETVAELARRYGKSRALIGRIKRREVWAEVINVVPTPPGRFAVQLPPSGGEFSRVSPMDRPAPRSWVTAYLSSRGAGA